MKPSLATEEELEIIQALFEELFFAMIIIISVPSEEPAVLLQSNTNEILLFKFLSTQFGLKFFWRFEPCKMKV